MEQGKKIVFVGANIFFMAKIAEQLKTLGYDVEMKDNTESVHGVNGSNVSHMIFDLNTCGSTGLESIKKLKSSPETASIRLIGFCGHTERALFEAARAFGCDVVTTNGVVSSQLSTLLERT